MTVGSARGVYGGGIKSIQRGMFSSSQGSEQRVTIAAVNPAKSMVNMASGGGGNNGVVSGRLLDATGIGLTQMAEWGFPTHWQVVEFY